MERFPVKNMRYLRDNPRAEIAWDEWGIPYNANIPVSSPKMQVVIPTHGRAARQITFKDMTDFLKQRVLIVTSLEADAKEIRSLHGDQMHDPNTQVISLQKYYKGKAVVDGIAKKRQWLVENIGAQSIFQMDDDMWRYARCPLEFRDLIPQEGGGYLWEVNAKGKKNGVRLIAKDNLTDDIYDKTFKKLANLMAVKKPGEKPEYVHVGLSSRMGNNQVPLEWKYVCRAMHSLGNRRDVLLRNDIKFDAVLLREDFYVTLKLLQLGFPNAVYYDVCISPSDYGAKGGASEERTVQISNDEAERLAAMFPPYVKVVEKEYTHSIPRKEVKIQWQQLFEKSRELNKLKTRKSLF